jgi:glycosyltransferase involved in cell wall biosynthesis
MKIAYFSPLNPLKSGISDFSEELLPYLKKNTQIDLFVAGYKPENDIINNEFDIFDIKEFENNDLREQYDIALYHIGNNYECHKEIVETFLKYGGILELHDISLHHYLAEDTIIGNNKEKYVEIMKICHGLTGEKLARQFLEGGIVAPWENRSMEFTVCKHLVDKAKGIIVHSDFAKQMIKGMNSSAKVINIPLHTPDIIEDFESYRQKCKQELKIDNEKIIMGAFGHATTNKRILQIIHALNILKKTSVKNFHFYIVGKVSGLDIDSLIKELDLADSITITGFTTLEQFKLYMGACDICFNLRYPTQGESSASLHRMLGLGKAVIVTKIGNFEEYPDDIVIKVRYDENEVDDIYQAINTLIKDNIRMKEMTMKSYQYASEYCEVRKNAVKYSTFINDIINDTYHEDFLDEVVDTLFELSLTEDKYINHLFTKLLL